MTPFLVTWAARAAFLSLLAGLATAACRRRGAHGQARAALQHGLTTSGMLALLALPLVMAVVPGVPLRLLRPAPAVLAGAVAVSPAPILPTPVAFNGRLQATPDPPRLAWSLGLAWLWLLGTAALGWNVVADWRSAARIVARAHPAEAMPDLWVSPEVQAPHVFGLRRPVILVPETFAAESRDRQQAILLHERAHVERWDCVWLLVARAACALYWWNPLVWIGARHLRAVGEQAADDRALLALAAAGDRHAAAKYAGHLVESARALRAAAGATTLPAAMSYCSRLEGRVRAILDGHSVRRPLGRPAALALSALAVAAVLPLAALQLVPKSVIVNSANLPRFDVTSVHPVKGGPGVGHVNEHGDPERLVITATLHYMIVNAYGIYPSQLSGEPAWIRSAYYTVEGATKVPQKQEQLLLMLRRLLADRFHLELRQTTREMPVYLLEVAPGGPKFKPLPPGAVPPQDPPRPAHSYARSFYTLPILVANLNGAFRQELHLDRIVLDRTGLAGKYSMYLSTTLVNGPTGPTLPDINSDLESQLGLRLVAAKAAIPAYVVLGVTRPTSN